MTRYNIARIFTVSLIESMLKEAFDIALYELGIDFRYDEEIQEDMHIAYMRYADALATANIATLEHYDSPNTWNAIEDARFELATQFDDIIFGLNEYTPYQTEDALRNIYKHTDCVRIANEICSAIKTIVFTSRCNNVTC